MSDNILITMKAIARERTNVSSGLITHADLKTSPYNYIKSNFDQIAAPLKDLVLPLLSDRYDGPVTIRVESRDGDMVFQNERSYMNDRLKQIIQKESQHRGLLAYGWQQQELEKHLVDVLFEEATKPVKKCLSEDKEHV